MLHAYMLLTVRIGMLKQVLDNVRILKEVIKAEAITGPYDVIIYLGAEGLTQLTKTILQEIGEIDGVSESITLIVVEL